MTPIQDFQLAATEAAQFLNWLDRARKGAEALQHAANIEDHIAEKQQAVKAAGQKLDTLRDQEAGIVARIEAAQTVYDDLMQRTAAVQKTYADAKASIAKLLEV